MPILASATLNSRSSLGGRKSRRRRRCRASRRHWGRKKTRAHKRPRMERAERPSAVSRFRARCKADAALCRSAGRARGGYRRARRLRPDAREMAVITENAAPRAMKKINNAGLFETAFERREVFKYQLRATFFDDAVGGHAFSWWGLDNCMWSNDYPHPNSTWPHSRKVVEELF